MRQPLAVPGNAGQQSNQAEDISRVRARGKQGTWTESDGEANLSRSVKSYKVLRISLSPGNTEFVHFCP